MDRHGWERVVSLNFSAVKWGRRWPLQKGRKGIDISVERQQPKNVFMSGPRVIDPDFLRVLPSPAAAVDDIDNIGLGWRIIRVKSGTIAPDSSGRGGRSLV